MPNCREIRIEIDGASGRDKLAPGVEQHLGGCGTCRDYATSTFQLMNLLMAQPRVEVPPDFDFRLKARIARVRDEQRGWRWALSQYLVHSFSWRQAGAAALVLMAMTFSATYYVTRDRGTSPTTEIAQAQVVSTPQTQPGSPVQTSTPQIAAIENQSTNVVPPAFHAERVTVSAPKPTVVAAGERPALTEIATADLPGSQEILVYQPGQAGKPAGSRSIIVPRRGQVTFGAQLASVREVGSRPPQGAIEAF